MYKVGIIGLGKIASTGWGKPGDPLAFSHAGGLIHSRKAELVAGADTSPAQIEDFRKTWGDFLPRMRYYASADEMLATERLEIVAVAVKTPLHHDMTMRVLDAGVRAVFLEKPMTCSLAEADRLLEAARARGSFITVAYARHWKPIALRFERHVREGRLGRLITVAGYVGGRVLHMGCHVTDMICQFAGYDPIAVTARGRWPDSTPNLPPGFEPEPFLDSMHIEFRGGLVAHQIGAPSDLDDFHVDVFGTDGMLRLPSYRAPIWLDVKRQPVPPEQWAAQPDRSVYTVAYDQIADHLDGGPIPACTGAEALKVHEIGMAAIESMLAGGARIELPLTQRDRRVYTIGK
jgi:predicted dehydrogenase